MSPNLRDGQQYAVCLAPVVARYIAGSDPSVCTFEIDTPNGPGAISLPASLLAGGVAAARLLSTVLGTTPAPLAPNAVPSMHLVRPAFDVDDAPPTPTSSWVVPAGYTSCGSVQLPDAPVALSAAQLEDRRVAATTDPADVIGTMGSLPHAVVPSLVLADTVGPYMARLRCTAAQVHSSVRALTGWAPHSVPLSSTPAVASLEVALSTVAEGTVRSAVKEIVRSRVSTLRLSGPHVPYTSLHISFRTELTGIAACRHITSLTLQATHLLIPAFRAQTAAALSVTCSDDLTALSNWLPNLEELHIVGSGVVNNVATELRNPRVFKSLTALTFRGSLSECAVVAKCRPWRRLTFALCDTMPASHCSGKRQAQRSVDADPLHVHTELRIMSVSGSATGPPGDIWAALGITSAGAPQLHTLVVSDNSALGLKLEDRRPLWAGCTARVSVLAVPSVRVTDDRTAYSGAADAAFDRAIAEMAPRVPPLSGLSELYSLEGKGWRRVPPSSHWKEIPDAERAHTLQKHLWTFASVNRRPEAAAAKAKPQITLVSPPQ